MTCGPSMRLPPSIQLSTHHKYNPSFRVHHHCRAPSSIVTDSSPSAAAPLRGARCACRAKHALPIDFIDCAETQVALWGVGWVDRSVKIDCGRSMYALECGTVSVATRLQNRMQTDIPRR